MGFIISDACRMTELKMVALKVVVTLACGWLAATAFAQSLHAQQLQGQPEARLVVIGEGSVRVAPDYAQVISGVTTRAKTVKEAADANSRTMAAATLALVQSGIARQDVQTSRFSVQPVYTPQQPGTEAKLSGYSVSNQVTINVRDLNKVGDILDHLITAGVTNVGGVTFLVSDQSKVLDQGRAAAIADARRKAEIYAQASQLRLGEVAWITEESGFAPPVGMRAQAAPAAMATSVPIAPGEDTLRVRVTVGFAIAH
jgi:uncharacterized protein YggE